MRTRHSRTIAGSSKHSSSAVKSLAGPIGPARLCPVGDVFAGIRIYPNAVPRLIRFVTALWALWFGAALVEPAAMQTCPMHGAHAAHGMSMPAGATHRSDHSPPARHSSHSCTCLGACCSAPTIAMPRAEIAALPVAAVVVAFVIDRYRDETAPAAAPRYSHPFANGPPMAPAA
jgi:hypothetical protein